MLAGGRSSEHDVSLSSGASVAAGLRTAGHTVHEIEIGRDGVWRRDGQELSVTPGRGLDGVDVAFPALHGPFGEDGTVQGMLEMLGVAYAGSGVEASALCMDKVRFKALMAERGVPQVDHGALTLAAWDADPATAIAGLSGLGLPVFVKPARLGSSVGIAKVADADALHDAVDAAFAHDDLVIVEAASPGAEVECALLEREDGTVQVSAPGRIEFDTEWYDYDAKYSAGGMRLTVPAPGLAPGAAERIAATARDAFAAAGCEGLARADFFVEDERVVLLNELNTMPGFTPYSVYGRVLDASGVPFHEAVDRLCRLAVARHERRAAMTF
ncbi:MAG TPA: D-alanine--D-alanine ligase family protein [Solirubrobacteraceae bacterium]|nr:D-alanine--D-alanine ligase family protein [Solirubrobacteraceae bacterium]